MDFPTLFSIQCSKWATQKSQYLKKRYKHLTWVHKSGFAGYTLKVQFNMFLRHLRFLKAEGYFQRFEQSHDSCLGWCLLSTIGTKCFFSFVEVHSWDEKCLDPFIHLEILIINNLSCPREAPYTSLKSWISDSWASYMQWHLWYSF